MKYDFAVLQSMQDGDLGGAQERRYCVNCGRPMAPEASFCPQCGHGQAPAHTPYGYQYGAPLPPPEPRSGGPFALIARSIGTILAVVMFIITAVNVVILLWGIGPVGDYYSRGSVLLFAITPWLVGLFHVPAFPWYLVLAAAITASFAFVLYQSFPSLGRELTFRRPREHSPLYAIGTVFAAVVAFNIIFNVLVEAFGDSPNVPETSTTLAGELLSYANASVWEEVIGRILLIGVPLLLFAGMSGRYRGTKAHKFLLGGGFKIGMPEAALLVFSSSMFGIAHYWNWDAYKVAPAMVAGFALGWLYLKYGLHASITLHFMIDYLSVPTSVWPDSLGIAIAIALVMLAAIAIGVPYFIRYVLMILGWALKEPIWPDAPLFKKPEARYPAAHVPYGPSYPPNQPYGGQQPYGQSPQYQYPQQQPYQPPYGQQPQQPYPQQPYQAPPPRYQQPADRMAIGFVCPHCGNQEAAYREGRLICSRCGK